MRKSLMQMVMGILICALFGCGCGASDGEVAVAGDDTLAVVATGIVETELTSEAVAEQATEYGSEILTETPTERENEIETEVVTETEMVTETEEELETEAPIVYTYAEFSATMYAKSSVNVRDLPCVDGKKVGSLATNDEVQVLGQCNETGWYKIFYKGIEVYVSNNYLVKEKVVVQTASGLADNGHNYYKNLSAEQAAEADAVAKAIADSIMADVTYTTDLERVNAAAQTVAVYCSYCAYGTDENKWYRSPYGVFVGGVYTCAGSTRALGRVLDFMGYSWQHVNPNQNTHQWCVVTMDGQIGYADGMGGFAGYGEMVSGMTLPDGRMIFF